MGTIDNMSGDQMRARIDELSNKEQAGELTDEGREELATLRSRM